MQQKSILQQEKQQTIRCRPSFAKIYGNKAFRLGASVKTRLSYKPGAPIVATVNRAGIITIKGVGKAVIAITAAQTEAYCRVTKKAVSQ